MGMNSAPNPRPTMATRTFLAMMGAGSGGGVRGCREDTGGAAGRQPARSIRQERVEVASTPNDPQDVDGGVRHLVDDDVLRIPQYLPEPQVAAPRGDVL